MDRPLELACYIGSINVRDIRGHMGSYYRQPSFPPTPKMIIPLTPKSLSMRIASGFPSLLTIRPPMFNRRYHLACQFADPQEIFKARNFCVAPHVQPNCKMRSIRSRGRKSSLNMTDTRRRRKTLPCERRRTFGAYVEGRFAGDAGSGKWRVASAPAGGPWSGRWVAGFGSVTGSTITLAPIFTRPYRSATSSLVSRIQPDETRFPIVSGLLVP
jgi:hypothetical protein